MDQINAEALQQYKDRKPLPEDGDINTLPVGVYVTRETKREDVFDIGGMRRARNILTRQILRIHGQELSERWLAAPPTGWDLHIRPDGLLATYCWATESIPEEAWEPIC